MLEPPTEAKASLFFALCASPIISRQDLSIFSYHMFKPGRVAYKTVTQEVLVAYATLTKKPLRFFFTARMQNWGCFAANENACKNRF